MSYNSFDLFNTLVATRCGSERAGDVPIEDLLPIAENIAKVKSDDFIISDYYDPVKALYILRNICKLQNELICTEDGKASGKMWGQYHPEHHLGDNEQIDVDTPRRYGIKTTLTTLWKPSEFTQFGLAIREARLTTWNNNSMFRGLQLHQIEKNFPFLLKVAFTLNNKMKEGKYNKLLLCSRDCYMLHILMKKLFTDYEIDYFYSNRLMRYYPTPEYLDYAKPMITDKTLIVDLCGSGFSLLTFCRKHGGNPLVVVSSKQNIPSLIHGGLKETINLAPEPTITVWPMETNFIVKEEIKVMIDALAICAEMVVKYKLADPDYTLDWAFNRIEDGRINCLWDDHWKETLSMEKLLVDKKNFQELQNLCS